MVNLLGEGLGPLAAFAAASVEPAEETTHLLAPCDLPAIKAYGVTFARSMVERVIEERAAGNPALAAEIRTRVAGRSVTACAICSLVRPKPPRSRRCCKPKVYGAFIWRSASALTPRYLPRRNR